MLILDEPTNHLDIESREVFEDALIEFPGTSVTVSHDRYLLNKVPTRIFDLRDGTITVFQGGYDYYLEKSEELYAGGNESDRKTETKEGKGARQQSEDSLSGKETRLQARREAKEKQAEQRRKERREQELEETIASLEKEIQELEDQLCSPEYLTDHVKLAELAGESRVKKELLEEAFSEWETLAE